MGNIKVSFTVYPSSVTVNSYSINSGSYFSSYMSSKDSSTYYVGKALTINASGSGTYIGYYTQATGMIKEFYNTYWYFGNNIVQSDTGWTWDASSPLITKMSGTVQLSDGNVYSFDFTKEGRIEPGEISLSTTIYDIPGTLAE